MSSEFVLLDPTNCIDSKEALKRLEKKISRTRTRLMRPIQDGGNPFLFAITATKIHELQVKDPVSDIPIKAAATNGLKFYWNPEFLDRLSSDEVETIMMHEVYHVILHHTTRYKAHNTTAWGAAIDYAANAILVRDHAKTSNDSAVWKGNIGRPLPLKQYLNYIDGKDTIIEGIVYRFVDSSLYGRTCESIYREILEHLDKSPRRCPRCHRLSIDPKTKQSKIKKPFPKNSCPDCGSIEEVVAPLDSHIPTDMDENEITSEVSKAIIWAEKIQAGSTPTFVEETLGQLQKPTINFIEIIKHIAFSKDKSDGIRNDWKRPRRRLLSSGYYFPQRKEKKPKWLCLIDTSASMGKKDIAFGLSQLKTLSGTEGYVVPGDAGVYWDKATKINTTNDLEKVEIVGRGGTMFKDFFRDFKKEMGNDFDLLIIITDGFCDDIPNELKPTQEVIWALTSATKNFSPTFGIITQLKTK